MKKVFVAHDTLEAHFVRGLLDSKGIEAEVRGEELFGIRGGVPVAPDTSPSVWVLDDSMLDDARDIIQQYEKGGKRDVKDARLWRCPQCGEEIDPNFTNCWNCGSERPPDS